MPHILKKPMSYYVGRLERNEYYSFAGYSDAEWLCILRMRLGHRTGFGQLLDGDVGKKLLAVLKRRQREKDFLFALPEAVLSLSVGARLDEFLRHHEINTIFYERDIVTDTAAEKAELFPFIEACKEHTIVLIGNRRLGHVREYVPYTYFVPTASPDLHMIPHGIDNAVKAALAYGKPAVYLVSAGISAALIIDKLHGKIPNSFFLDCGSIWDAFVGIGGQRSWRRDLYENPEALERWKRENLHGKD